MREPTKSREASLLEANPYWYKDAVIYELHVRAFADGNGDGIGDFRGLTEKLGYLQDLGVTAVWLLPFYPSPLRDDGYDISDYGRIHPDYGNLQDFKSFLKEAHRRGLRVITELVINHTSDQHPWFQRARRAPPKSKARQFYVWSDTPERYQEARIIFKDFEPANWSWDPVAKAYYWHRFYAHQPDLNFDLPEVRKAVLDILDFWLGMGVDGLRLDAVPYLYEREGTNCENLPETHAFLKELRRHIDKKFRDRMLLAEANQWPEDAVQYFGSGDESHMAFHFPLMPRLFMAIHMEDRFPIIDILEQTPRIAENCQWALFLRNHDELTLEMVTDEDRDYMYRVYASDPRAQINLGIRRRLAPLLGNNRRKIELMMSLLFSLPGTPVVYYGDEIGMGDNIYLGDRNGVRTPMQWSADRNAGFSRANPQQLYLPVIIDPEYHYEASNVEAQQQNPHSLLWWGKRLVQLRTRFQCFSRGSIGFLNPENQKVLAFIRCLEDELVLVVANLSRFVQCAEIDLPLFKGMTPIELFGQTNFPPIGDLPYFITLGPHSFYWFKIEDLHAVEAQAPAREEEPPLLEVADSWERALRGKGRGSLERILPSYLKNCRWFGGKGKQIRSVKVVETLEIPFDSSAAQATILEVQYSEGDPDHYLLPLAFGPSERGAEIQQASPTAVLARVKIKNAERDAVGILYDALFDGRFDKALLEAVSHRRSFKGDLGRLSAWPSRFFQKLKGPADAPLEPAPLKREQSNTSVVYGDKFILKVFRRLAEGMNPDLEIGRFLTEKGRFSHCPALAGALEYQRGHGAPTTLGILHGLVHNEGDTWSYTLDHLGRYFEESLARPEKSPGTVPASILDLEEGDEETTARAREVIGSYLESARLLGQRTGELHTALGSRPDDPAFAPEPFTPLYRRSLYQGMRAQANQVLALLRKRLKNLPDGVRRDGGRILDLEKEIFNRFRIVLQRKIPGMRIRCHGDYHLGQVLFTGKDFVIIDFEGEPSRSLGERRLKRSPLRDVSGMLQSFRYASLSKLKTGSYRPEDCARLKLWAHFWYAWVSATFLKSYLAAMRDSGFLPKSKEEIGLLLHLYLLEKAIYELGYEMNHRPEWVDIPMESIFEILRLGPD